VFLIILFWNTLAPLLPILVISVNVPTVVTVASVCAAAIDTVAKRFPAVPDITVVLHSRTTLCLPDESVLPKDDTIFKILLKEVTNHQLDPISEPSALPTINAPFVGSSNTGTTEARIGLLASPLAIALLTISLTIL
jgi:hypothetical protein